MTRELWPADVTDVVEVRRDLHAHPELGFTEIRTAARVAAALSGLGWTVRAGREVFDPDTVPGLPEPAVRDHAVARALDEGVPAADVERFRGGATAVVADLAGTRPGPVIALRCDMDALPIEESTGADHLPARLGFRSRHAGVMHACGHDGHVAIGLALAAALADRDFPGRIRLLFQPAEEGVRGAEPMVAAGVCTGVDALLAIHLGFGLPTGEIAAATTELHATGKYVARFTGRAAHASSAPQHGRNALLAAATAALGLHALPRFAGVTTRVNVGRLIAGTATNIVPDCAELAYETRAATADVQHELDRRAELVLHGAATAYEVEHELRRTGYATAATTDDAVAAAVTAAAQRVPGVRRVRPTHALGASDDASLLMAGVQEAGGVAGYTMLGSTGPAPHHTRDFDLDEAALPIGVALLEDLVRAGRLAPTAGGRP
jgi:aminobenzoyl-glutamate utilization protein A